MAACLIENGLEDAGDVAFPGPELASRQANHSGTRSKSELKAANSVSLANYMKPTQVLNRTTILTAGLLLTAALFTSCRSSSPNGAVNAARHQFSFALTADIRQFTGPKHPGPQYFEGACSALRDLGPGDFIDRKSVV